MTAARIPEPAMLAVYDGRTCIGHLLARGKTGFEAFDHDERSLGVYPNQRKAVCSERAARCPSRGLRMIPDYERVSKGMAAFGEAFPDTLSQRGTKERVTNQSANIDSRNARK